VIADRDAAPPPGAALELLREGALARLAVPRPAGLHLTPLVYAISGERLWVTTSRSSVKARAWSGDPRAGGLVRTGTGSVVFIGRVTRHDVLDPDTWMETLPRAGSVLRAAAAFTRRNARFFAGYAVDARSIPLAWTPPGRVFAEIELTRGLVIEEGEVTSRWGRWPHRTRSDSGDRVFRALRSRGSPFDGVPAEVAERLGSGGSGALALRGGSGDSPVVLPVSWGLEAGGVLAAVPGGLLRVAGTGRGPAARGRAALEVDAGSEWRASEMVGAMLVGEPEFFSLGVASSRRSSTARALDDIRTEPAEDALVRIRPERVTWWQGWSSGTVARR
jgi:hypothetical protein